MSYSQLAVYNGVITNWAMLICTQILYALLIKSCENLAYKNLPYKIEHSYELSQIQLSSTRCNPCF
ncbi:hypothetical protein ENHY17A_50331 [Moraxellaceae bacterium 17A]|nr:hypothetical protein ENHY17A_50331 [Moraxellaceae bacterium 17A]